MEHYFLAIDGKSFFASCECVDRQLDPLTTNLVVADASRTDKTICLAVSPSLKALGIPGRARLFEVVQKVNEANARRRLRAPKGAFYASSHDANALAFDPGLEISYLVAPPRMARYMEMSARIYRIYLEYVAPEDIFPYSIDESFLDISSYLRTYQTNPHDLAMTIVRRVLSETGITATCGIGTNLYLAKVAMDIVAKKATPDADGVRIAQLDELSYRRLLWSHRPLTDFWRIGRATARKLEQRYIYTMGDLARYSLHSEDQLYALFGIDAEILIDHAWGVEPVQMHHVQAYEPESTSLSEGQVLSRPYDFETAKIIVREMAENVSLQLFDRRRVTDSLTLDIGYDRENCDKGIYHGAVKTDRYGRCVPPPAHGSVRFDPPTNLSSRIIDACLSLFADIANPRLTLRRVTILANHLQPEDSTYQLNLFTDTAKQEQEKKLQEAMLSVKKRFGKNALIKGTSLLDGATGRDRNQSIGGHHE